MLSDNLLGLIPISDTLPLSHLIRALSALFFLFLVAKAGHNFLFSPLAHIPGPWYSRFSGLELLFHALSFRQSPYIDKLFKRYGPVIRVAPNQVAFVDTEAMKIVYGTAGKFSKSSWYKGAQVLDLDHAMTTLEQSAHAIKRKTYAAFYVPAHLSKFQPETHDFINEMIQRLEAIEGKASVDCLPLFRHLAVEVNGVVMFGAHLSIISKWAAGYEDPLSTAVSDFPKRAMMRGMLPKWAWPIVSRIPNARWKQFCASDRILNQFVGQRIIDTRNFLQTHTEQDDDVGKSSLLAHLIQYRYAPGEPLTENEVLAESLAHLIAGSETTATTATYILWELSRRPDIVKAVRQEIDQVMPDSRLPPDILVLQALPYFSALIKEGLRIYTAASSLLPRVVPEKADLTINGYYIPADTVIATQAFTLHRDPSVFSTPNRFQPERWLPENETEEMKSHYMPFGYGSRICGGQNLSSMMLRILLASLIRNFDIVANTDETNDDTMDMRDSFVNFPAAGECKLSFVPRNA